MSLDLDFQAKLSAVAGAPASQNYVPSNQVQPRVWWQRHEGEPEIAATGELLIQTTVYSVEVQALDPDAGGAIYDALVPALHGFRGLMGSTRVLGAFVERENDNYEPRHLQLDDGYHVFGFKVRVLT